MHPILPFQKRVEVFNCHITSQASAQELTDQISKVFSASSDYTVDNARLFMSSIGQQLEKVAKIFSRLIPHHLLNELAGVIVDRFKETSTHSTSLENTLDNIPEPMRAYIALRCCQEKDYDAKDIVQAAKMANISHKHLLYKFAIHAAKRQVSDFTNELTDFGIQDLFLRRRLAEVALYFDADAFLSDLNEFSFFENPIREEFYLRGLTRSVGIVDKLIEDEFFLFSLENFPSQVLEFLYSKFHFGRRIIQEAIQNAKVPPPTLEGKKSVTDFLGVVSPGELEYLEKTSELLKERRATTDRSKQAQKEVLIGNEAKLFAFLIQNASSLHAVNEMGFKSINILNDLEDNEKFPLLAIILLLKSLDNPELAIQTPEILGLLEELTSFHDPSARFATVALALIGIKKGRNLLTQLITISAPGKDNPKIFSLVVSACRSLFEDTSIQDLEKKWKDINFRKHFLRFLAELFFSEKLSDSERGNLLSRCIKNKELQTVEALVDFSVCLSSRLIKQLNQGEAPQDILFNRQLSFVNRLGKPYGLSMDSNTFKKLKHTREISYYAQALEKLPESEKQDMVPFFFSFLSALATDELRTARFATPELQDLFQNYPAFQGVWNKDTESTVQEILKHFPTISSHSNETLDIQAMLLKAFEEKHLHANDHKAFYEFALGKTAKAPLLEGRVFGAYVKKGSPEQKKEAIVHLLSKLFIAKQPSEQKRFLDQLEKLFPKEHDFNVDIKNWKKALDQQITESKKDYKSYKIVRSADPYVLFRIGSIAGESCQRVTGDPAKNKCLLAYPYDGKNEVIYAQNTHGEIEARAILRFFYACNPEKVEEKWFPVLYLEPFYPAGAPGILRKAMACSAIECARELKIPLVRHLKINEEALLEARCPYNLATINGPAPFEYFDGTNSKVKQNNKTYTFKYLDESINVRASESISYIQNSEVMVIFNPDKPDRINF